MLQSVRGSIKKKIQRDWRLDRNAHVFGLGLVYWDMSSFAAATAPVVQSSRRVHIQHTRQKV